ncbi:MAG: hypothetical protein KAH03_03230 [Cocleimonas sp.]|nr:hypothetical protein [Cocleimonas sp.]
MINTTSMQISVPMQNTNQLTDIKNTLSELQKLPASTSLPLATLNSLLQLVQNLVKELGDSHSTQDKPAHKEGEINKPELKNNPASTHSSNEIVGTEGDDLLNGNHDNNRMQGLGGDDRLLGRQGNDVMLGGSGDDQLYGGSGDDNLIGGSGDDYLAGGRGNNQLSGGNGNDILNSRLGNDFLDGGSGNDTARVRANIDDYSIEVTDQDPPVIGPAIPQNDDLPAIGAEDDSKIILTHKETGQRIEVINTESFKFNDVTLSLDEMKARAETTTPPNNQIALSDAEQEGVLGVFGSSGAMGNAGVRVIDNDGDGQISTGDTAILATGNANSVSQQFKDLSDDDITSINNHVDESQVQLTAAQQFAAEAVTGLSNIYINDEDDSGTLSEGDIAVSSGPDSQQYTLTASDVDAILSFQPPYVEITPVQQTAIESVFGIKDPIVDDHDLSGTLSEGDIIRGSDPSDKAITLTAANIDAINSNIMDQPPRVEITAAQKSAIQSVTGLSDIYVNDNDSSASLSEGDIVISARSGDQHELTATDLEMINSFQPPYVDNLNPTQLNAIETRTGLSDFHVDDNDLSGELSVGDTVVSLDDEIASVTLTADDITAIKENSVTGPMNIGADLKSLLEQSPDFSNIEIYSGSNNGRLGAGDIVVADSSNPDSATYTLTLDDEINNTLNGISLDSVLPRVSLSTQEQEDLTAIATTFTTPVDHGVYVFDHDKSGSFSAGDTIIPIDSSGPMYDITEDDIANNMLFDQPFDFNT